MLIIFKGTLQFCLTDHLNHWLTCFVICKAFSDKTFHIEFWAGEEAAEKDETARANEISTCKTRVESPYLLFQTTFPVNGCVVGKRGVACFLSDSFNEEELKNFPEELFFLSTGDATINIKGENAPYLAHQLQYKRCESQAEVHDYVLDNVYHVFTDIGEVDVDETEFLLAVTPSDIALISLYRRCISRTWPIVGIRKYGISEDKLKLELGKRVPFGDRTYEFRSADVNSIRQAIKSQINIISMVIHRHKSSQHHESSTLDTEMSVNKRYSDSNIGLTTGHNSGGLKPSHLTLSANHRYSYQDMQPDEDIRTSAKQNFIYDAVEISGTPPKTPYENADNFFCFEEPISPEYEVTGVSLDDDSFLGSEHFDRVSSSGDSDLSPALYPNVELPYESIAIEDEEVLYERISSELQQKSRGGSDDVIYQDIEIRSKPERGKRRNSRHQPLVPTFVSYIEGGLEGLIRYQMQHDGLYDVLYDPMLAGGHKIEEGRASEPIYDMLKRS